MSAAMHSLAFDCSTYTCCPVLLHLILRQTHSGTEKKKWHSPGPAACVQARVWPVSPCRGLLWLVQKSRLFCSLTPLASARKAAVLQLTVLTGRGRQRHVGQAIDRSAIGCAYRNGEAKALCPGAVLLSYGCSEAWLHNCSMGCWSGGEALHASMSKGASCVKSTV
eukprot:1139511-Pelagomonas_calceolata.AAC.5